MPQKLSTYRYIQLRAVILLMEPVCRICKQNPSVEVDHKLPRALGGTDERRNLQAVCKPCHRIKTTTDMGLISILKIPSEELKCVYNRKKGWYEIRNGRGRVIKPRPLPHFKPMPDSIVFVEGLEYTVGAAAIPRPSERIV